MIDEIRSDAEGASLYPDHRLDRQKCYGSIVKIDMRTARKAGEPRPLPLDDRLYAEAMHRMESSQTSNSDQPKNRRYLQSHEGISGYLLGIGEMIAGGALMASGAVVEIGSFGLLTIAVGFQEAAGFAMLTDGFARTMRSANDFSSNLPPITWKGDGRPRTNTAQNDQFSDAVKEIEKKLGKKLDKNDQEKLHDLISGQNYGYHDIIEE